jgi:hypothetical protein
LKESLPGAFSRFALKSTAGVERQICSRRPIGMFSAVYQSTAVLRMTRHAVELRIGSVDWGLTAGRRGDPFSGSGKAHAM